MNREFLLYKTTFEQGVDLQYGKLTLCDLSHYSVKVRKYRYQIYCDDRKATFTKLYKENELDTAISKFIEIKKQISPRAR